MKKMIFLAMAILSLNAFAFEKQEFKLGDAPFVLVDLEENMGTSIKEGELDFSKYPNGVYVAVINGSGKRGYPEVEKMAQSYLKVMGANIVETIEGADVYVQILLSGTSVNLTAVNNMAANNGISAGKTAVNAGGVIGAAIANGATVGLGALIGTFIPYDEKAVLGIQVHEHPVAKHNWIRGDYIAAKSGDWKETINTFQYQVDSDNKPTDDKVFRLLMEQWAKKYVKPQTQAAQM